MVTEDGEVSFIEDLIGEGKPEVKGDVYIMIDRAVIRPGDEDLQFRLSDSVQTAFFEGHGTCLVRLDDETRTFSDRFELDGMSVRGAERQLLLLQQPLRRLPDLRRLRLGAGH